jgi:hypothetical protein
MVVKMFVLGRPGSGKSAAVRYLSMLARDNGWSTRDINDYTILYEMFQQEMQQRELHPNDMTHHQFEPAAHGGFDVHDLSVFDTALQTLEQQATDLEQEDSRHRYRIIFIEFARNDYLHALQQFTASFLKDAFFLFIKADIPTCKQRIRQRAAHPQTPDDHFVSAYIFETYYNHDDGQYPILELNNTHDRYGTPYSLNKEHIYNIANSAETSFEQFHYELAKVSAELSSCLKEPASPQGL